MKSLSTHCFLQYFSNKDESLIVAIKNGKPKKYRMHYILIDQKTEFELHNYHLTGDVAEVESLIKSGANVNASNECGMWIKCLLFTRYSTNLELFRIYAFTLGDTTG